MLESIFALALISSLVTLPLVWSSWIEAQEKRALLVRAEIHAAVVRVLGGESVVTVRVLAPTPWREGRVFLSAPAGCEHLVSAVWERVAREVPRDYDLIMRPSLRRIPALSSVPVAWGHAA